MPTFNDIPNEASPQLTDRAFICRGTEAGAERKTLLSSIRALFATYFDTIYARLASSNIFTAAIGFGANPAASVMDTSVPVYMARTSSNPTGVSLGLHAQYELAHTASQIVTAGLFDVINTGNSAGGGGHMLGVIGRTMDTASGQGHMYGVEGKTIRKGSSDADAAFWGISDYDGPTYSGRQRNVFAGFAEIFNGTPATPVAEGAVCIFKAMNGPGGDPAQRFALQGDLGMKITTGGAISSFDPVSAAQSIKIEHDGSDAKISTSSGAIRLYAPDNFVVLQSGYGLVPLVQGSALGIDGYRWAVAATSVDASSMKVTGYAEYADNAAAVAAGLAVGQHYRTGDLVKVVHS